MNERDEHRERALEQLLTRVGVPDANRQLVERALTHASVTEHEDSNWLDYEALEFLGDAALGLAVAHYLYETRPEGSPGEYSQLRAHVVNKNALARVAQRWELGPAIRLGKGEEQSGGRARASLLADCVESLIGAMYLDRGWEETRRLVLRMFDEELRVVAKGVPAWDYKSQLQQYCQAERIPLPEFVTVRAAGPDHAKEFDVEVRLEGVTEGWGTGRSKKEAEQNAARQALEGRGVIEM